jgi:O-antigen/teichoic acid export membrane protein
LQSVILVILFHRKVKTASRFSLVSLGELKIFLSFSVLTLVTNSIQFLAYRMDYWFIEYYRGEKELGWYSLAVRLAQVFWVLPVLFAAILFPQVAKEGDRYNDGHMLSFARLLFLFNLLAGALAFLLAGWGIPLVFGEMYRESVLLFRLLLPGIVLFCPTTILAAWFAGKGQLRVNLKGSCICFAVVAVLDVLLVPRQGMRGASIASSIGYTLTSVYTVAVYCQQTNTPVHKLFFFRQADWQYLRQAFYATLIKRAR